MPSVSGKEGSSDASKCETGLHKISLLQIESYWTYELCHGKHIKQYHENKELGLVSCFDVHACKNNYATKAI